MVKKQLNSKDFWKNKMVLITGGTGSFGKKFIKIILKEYPVSRVVVFSRDELKQEEMRTVHGFNDVRLRYFIGDVRNKNRLDRAFKDIDVVIHAAALKQVPSCEYNPIEAVETNIGGAENVINAAIDNNVKKVLALSTDKAVNPINLYGATKLVAEKLIIQGNNYSSLNGTKFSCVRYGNVVGSRGSVIPLFMHQKKSGTLTLTDEKMTRFWITLEQAVRFVIRCIEIMSGGEIFIPKIPSMKLFDLAKAIGPKSKLRIIGVRPGEKINEALVSADEIRNTYQLKDMFVIRPLNLFREPKNSIWSEGKILKKPYTSNNNKQILSRTKLKKIINEKNL